MKRRRPSFFDYLGYYAFRFLAALFSVIPFWLTFRLADLLFFILFDVVRYRYAIISSNIRASFPEYTDAEVKKAVRAFYRNLSDIALESIKGLTMGEAEVRRRFYIRNPDLFSEDYARNQSILVLGSHYVNWEWGALAFQLFCDHQTVGIYKTIKNKLVEGYFKRLRSQWGMVLCPMKQTGRALLEYKDAPAAFFLIADQTPSDLANAHWVNFLGRETPFLHGADKIARRGNLPVYYYDTRRVGRGFYEIEFSPICLKPASMPEGAVTQAYAAKLESIIREYPPDWLWSHKRWKHRRVVGR